MKFLELDITQCDWVCGNVITKTNVPFYVIFENSLNETLVYQTKKRILSWCCCCCFTKFFLSAFPYRRVHLCPVCVCVCVGAYVCLLLRLLLISSHTHALLFCLSTYIPIWLPLFLIRLRFLVVISTRVKKK